MVRSIVALTLAISLLGTPAVASAPTDVSGDFAVTSATVTGIRVADDTCFIDLDATFAFTGSLEGAFTAHFVITHHGGCFEPAAESFRAIGTYAGTVTIGGETLAGTFDFVFNGTIDAAGTASGDIVVLAGTAGLAGLHGTIGLAGTAGVGGTYVGGVHVDPES